MGTPAGAITPVRIESLRFRVGVVDAIGNTLFLSGFCSVAGSLFCGPPFYIQMRMRPKTIHVRSFDLVLVRRQFVALAAVFVLVVNEYRSGLALSRRAPDRP
jgi:hypothetical protein